MNDLETTIVITPAIPLHDMTPLERLVLSHIFDAEETEEGLLLYSDRGAAKTVSLPAEAVIAAYPVSRRTPDSELNQVMARYWRAQIDLQDTIDVDLSETSWEIFLRDIVARSVRLSEIRVLEWYRHPSQAPDSFGVNVMLITATGAAGRSSDDLFEELRADSENQTPAEGFRRSPGVPDLAGADPAIERMRTAIDRQLTGRFRAENFMLDPRGRNSLTTIRRFIESFGAPVPVAAPDGAATVVDPEEEAGDPPVAGHPSALHHALYNAERFVRGFEGDELQEGVDDLLAQMRAALQGRTDRQVIDETNQLARYIMAELVGTGYQVPDGWKFYDEQDPRSGKAWKYAVSIMEMLTFTNADDALSNLDSEELDPESRFPVEDWQYEVANGDTRRGYEDWLDAKCSE